VAAEPRPPLRTTAVPGTLSRASRTVLCRDRAKSSAVRTVRELAISRLGVSTRVAETTTSCRRSSGFFSSAFWAERAMGIIIAARVQ